MINAVGFAMEGYGYIGTGYDGSELQDFYQYNPSNDTWTDIPSLGGKRKDAVAFVIGTTAYVCTGIHNGSYEYDLWALQADLIGTDTYPWEKKLSLVDTYIYTDVSISQYLNRLKDYGENPSRYNTIWYYY